MTIMWSARDLSFALNQIVDFEANKPRFNSKSIEQNDFFIALKGNTDGHNYIHDAFKRGASCAIASYVPQDLPQGYKERLIIVEDTYRALLSLAKYRRQNCSAKFIAITGSSGKTSTKEALAYVLAGFGTTFANEGNFNNHIGVPITLASMPYDAQYVILEVGMNHAGEIKPLAELIKAHISIITNILPAHIGNFNSLEDIAREKSQIIQSSINKTCAIFHQNTSPEINSIILKATKDAAINTVLTFGQEGANAVLMDYRLIEQDTALIKSSFGGMIYDLKTKLIGKHHALNLLSVILVIYYLDLNLGRAIRFIEKFQPVSGRGQRISVKKFGKEFSVIDDTYNANPGSVEAALENLKHMMSKKKVAVLGDMLELGDREVVYHKDLLGALQQSGIYKFIAIGPLMKNLYNEVQGIEKYYFHHTDELLDNLSAIIDDGDMVLFKASRSLQLSEAVKYLTNRDV